jgi:hypothetical protein
MKNMLVFGDASFVLDKVTGVLFNENYAGESNTLLVYVMGKEDGIPVRVRNPKKAFAEITARLEKALENKGRS